GRLEGDRVDRERGRCGAAGLQQKEVGLLSADREGKIQCAGRQGVLGLLGRERRGKGTRVGLLDLLPEPVCLQARRGVGRLLLFELLRGRGQRGAQALELRG